MTGSKEDFGSERAKRIERANQRALSGFCTEMKNTQSAADKQKVKKLDKKKVKKLDKSTEKELKATNTTATETAVEDSTIYTSTVNTPIHTGMSTTHPPMNTPTVNTPTVYPSTSTDPPMNTPTDPSINTPTVNTSTVNPSTSTDPSINPSIVNTSTVDTPTDPTVIPSTATANSTADDQPKSFNQLELDPRLLRALERLRFNQPTLIQSKTIQLALEGKDVLGKAKTGSGKTAAYSLPLLQKILRRSTRPTDVCT
jgi:superfamily II RNA helicase